MPAAAHIPRRPPTVAASLLRWYDKNARVLPWRIGPQEKKNGVSADPYHVWLSEVMLQQTTVATVAPRYRAFLERWPTVSAMAAAPIDDVLGQWAGLGYYARARNLHKCAVTVARDYDGAFPTTEEALKSLPGVGAYTAAAIAAIAFDRRVIVVDGNIERVASRLFEIETPLPAAKPEIRAAMDALWPARRSGDFAQGLMDLGAGVCRPKKPLCDICPLTDHCAAFASEKQETFPRKPPKKDKPLRLGAAYALIRNDGAMLFERRPEKGLLGGMLGLPGTDWAGDKPSAAEGAPCAAKWAHAGEIDHTFTHFRLRLDILVAAAPKSFRLRRNQQWLDPQSARIPTVMAKAMKAALAAQNP